MYQTVDRLKTSGATHQQGNSFSEKFSIRSSYDNVIFKNQGLKAKGSGSETTLESVHWLKDFCTTFLSVNIGLALTFVIVLWLVALIADGPDEMHSCVIIWPVVAGVLAIAVLFLILKVAEFFLKERVKKRNIKETKIGFDSLRLDSRRGSDPANFSVYHRHSFIGVCYIFLAFSLFVIMIVSVAQYFSLSSSCYHHLEHNVEELLLGYQVLAYLSVVVLSIVGCLLSCFLLGIVINCCSSKQPDKI